MKQPNNNYITQAMHAIGLDYKNPYHWKEWLESEVEK